MKRVIDKTVNLDLVGVNGNAFMIMGVFQKQARKEQWPQEDIDAVLSEAKSKDYNYLLATIANHCQVRDEGINREDVWEVLSQLGHHTHYLASKAITDWDEYDHSNYKSLRIKAGKDKL